MKKIPTLRALTRSTTTVVSEETGQVLQETTYLTKVQSKSKEDFGFLYRSGVEKLATLGGLPVKVYLWALMGAQIGKGTVYLDAEEKKAMRSAMKCSVSGIQQALRDLLAAGLLVRLPSGRYELVREFGWRGKAGGREYSKETKNYPPPPGFDK